MIESDTDKEKFNKLFYTCHDKLLSVAMAVTKDFYDAEDALQNAFYIIAKKILQNTLNSVRPMKKKLLI